MKHSIRPACGLAVFWTVISLSAYAQTPPPGYIDFGKFSPPAAGGEFVEVQIKSNLIAMAARLAEKSEPEIADLIRSLQLIRVNVIGLNNENRAEMEKRVKAIRSQLDAQGWEGLVIAQQKNEDVGIYIKTRGEDTVLGLVVTVLEGNREAVLINIVGDLKPDKIATIAERFNLEPLKKASGALKKR